MSHHPQPFDLTDAPAPRPQRTGTSRLERGAIARVRTAVAAMPASLVVQLALWPDELARWARAERVDESVVYNMLGRRKPYLRIRERLAARLGVQTGLLARLVDGTPAPLPEGTSSAEANPAPRDLPEADVADEGRRGTRDGTNPVERRAVHQVEAEIAAMPASTVVGLVLWPTTITAWAREAGLHPSAVWATLAGAPSEGVTWALARRLGVSARELVALVEAERQPAGATRTSITDDHMPSAPVGPPPGRDTVAPPAPAPAPTERRSAPAGDAGDARAAAPAPSGGPRHGAGDGGDQLALGL